MYLARRSMTCVNTHAFPEAENVCMKPLNSGHVICTQLQRSHPLLAVSGALCTVHGFPSWKIGVHHDASCRKPCTTSFVQKNTTIPRSSVSHTRMKKNNRKKQSLPAQQHHSFMGKHNLCLCGHNNSKKYHPCKARHILYCTI